MHVGGARRVGFFSNMERRLLLLLLSVYDICASLSVDS